MVMMDIYYVHFVDDVFTVLIHPYWGAPLESISMRAKAVPFDGVQGTISRKQTTKSLRKMRVEAVSLVETREKNLN